MAGLAGSIMQKIQIEQALYGGQGAGGYRFLARSSGFLEEWLPEAERLCTGFGDRPAGVACPACVFAQPLGTRHVAVVQVADQGVDDAGRPGALGFRLLVLPRKDYVRLGGDPFLIADRNPPPWHARGDLPSLTWPGGPPPPRTVEEVQRILQRADGEVLIPETEIRRGGSHVLLGGTQVLVDGGKLVFERPAPDTELLCSLWTLLPISTRCGIWPASFSFGNALRFAAVVVPPVRHEGLAEEFAGYVTEVQAADYPEGRYELSLQTAAEAGDQKALDTLFARRARGEMFRMILVLLAVVLVLGAVIQWLPLHLPAPPGPQPNAPPGNAPALDLPPPERCPHLTNQERKQLTAALAELAGRLDVQAPPDATAEQLLEAIDQRLGTPDPQRNPGRLRDLGPVQRQLRALLWKHGVAEYREPGLNSVELVERLEQKVAGPKPAGKDAR